MPRPRVPELQPIDAYRQAVRSSSGNLKDRFRGDPETLAKFLNLKLPVKPVQKMIELGLITPQEAVERFGEQFPGLRELVLETCLLEILSAVAVGPRGGGKAIRLSEVLLTPSGHTTMGGVQVGDTLYDRDGEPCRVTHVYEIDPAPESYEIVFNDGSTIICCGDHKWITETHLERAANYMHDKRTLREDGWHSQWTGHREGVRTTREILETLRSGSRGDLNHSVANTKPVKFPCRDLPLDPYLLGVWLGDGDKTQGIISVGKEDVDELQSRLERRGHSVERIPDNNGNFRLRVAGLTLTLRAMKLLGDKRVPALYLRSSVAQRRWLLAGLMDSDGTIRNYSNCCSFDNTNESLADAVYELVVSLGWKATKNKSRATLYGVDCGPCYQISFTSSERVFRLRRKHVLFHPEVAQQQKHFHRMVVDVRSVPSEPMRCIEVDSPSHTYLVGEQMVPTHNSQGVSFIEFYLWFILEFDALNLGGSEHQAANVYDYLQGYVDAHQQFASYIDGEMKVTESRTKAKNWIKVLTASSKSVRSPHAGGIRNIGGRQVRRGGILVIDEEAEAEPEIVKAALPTINTARPSVNIRSSTFHNEGGSFAEVVEDHEEMGYKLYRWDVFDVCEGCDCVGDTCQSPEPCFREDHYEDIINPETGQSERKLKHLAYCGGRAKYAQGWVPMQEIYTYWKRIKRHHETFEIEQMGSRPGSKGYVIKDRKKFKQSIVEEEGSTFYLPGFPASLCVDWGTVAAGVTLWQSQPGDKHVLLYAELVEDAGLLEIMAKINEIANTFGASIMEVAADIGGGGNYLNPYLRDNGYNVRDVKFAEEKEAAVAAMNIYNEADKLIIPGQYEDFIKQVRNWRRVNGRIVKAEDHLCDSAICYFSKFINDLGVSHYRVPPATFSTIAPGTDNPLVPGNRLVKQEVSPASRPQLRAPVAVVFGPRR